MAWLGCLGGPRRMARWFKMFIFPTFPAGIAFVDRVAVVAEAMGHHPDITISYTRVTMRLSTHDEGGVTEKDIALAGGIEAAAQG